MKLQLRFFLVLAAIFIAAAAFLLLQQHFEIDRSKSVLASELTQRKAYLQNLVNLEGRSEQSFAEDYSFWDDMVNFVKHDNIEFAQENLDTGLSTFNTDADWVFRPDGSLLYFSSADGSNSLRPITLPQGFFTQLTNNKFTHFYQRINGRLVEIRAATIVPSNDPKHSTAAQGFLLIGRTINKSYLNSIATLSGDKIDIEGADAASDQTTASTVSFGEQLRGWDGKVISVLHATTTVPIVSDLKHQYNRQLESLAVFTVLASGIIITLIWWLVLRPVKIINRAIKLQQPNMLQRLRLQNTEFGRLAQTVTEFFQQKVSLAEAEFKKTELEKLNKEKASFLAVAAHELNGPVANVKLFAEYLSFLVAKKQSEAEIMKQLHRIEHQSIKINMLLNDLRAASTGKQNLEFNLRDFDFDSFLTEEVEEAAFSIKNKLNLFCNTNAQVHSDPDRLGQVVTNLIRNAMKYSPNGGDILIHGRLQDGMVVVSVQDFGMGIGPDDLPHLFERFYRSAKVSAAYPGLGLGLYISKTILESLGGKIWVDSQLGKGSTFFFSLPALAGSIPAKLPPAASR